MIDHQTLKKAQKGDENSIQEIFLEFRHLIYMRAKKFFFYGADRDDVIQEAMIGLLKAINAYDDRKKASFPTFAALCIKRQLITALKSSNSGKHRILNMAVPATEENQESKFTYSNNSLQFCNPEDIFMSKEKFKALDYYLKNNLSKMENEIFEYMLTEMSYTEIAKITGREPKSVDNSIQRIKKKLKKFLDEYDKN